MSNLHDKVDIAVVVPVYNGKAVLLDLINRLRTSLDSISKDWMIVLVDDRGQQDVWSIIQSECKMDPRIKGVRLSRNFGQHAAITAGLDYANAHWYVVMDCDLQDLPEDIPALHQKALDGEYDSVLAVREQHHVSSGRKLGSWAFNFALEKLAGIPASSKVGNYRIFNHKMAEAYKMYPEKMRLFPALMGHMGFEIGELPITRPDRNEGKSNYSGWMLIQLAFDSIISNTIKPMYFFAGIGILITLVSFLIGAYIIIYKILYGIEVDGWTSLIISLLFVSGARIFLQQQNRIQIRLLPIDP